MEIHSAHGYLLDQFYSPLTNRRTDDYTGRTLEGRTRLQVEIIQAIRRRLGKDFVLSLRLGGSDYMDGGAVCAEVGQAAKLFEAAGLDMLSLSGGIADGAEAETFLEKGQADLIGIGRAALRDHQIYQKILSM